MVNKFSVVYIDVHFDARIGADVVHIIGSNGHPVQVADGQFAVQDVALQFIDLHVFPKKPVVQPTLR